MNTVSRAPVNPAPVRAFSAQVAELIRCPGCVGPLDLAAAGGPERRCRCGRRYRVDDGVLSLLEEGSLRGESRREHVLRDRQARTLRRPSAQEVLADADEAMEMEPTLECLALRDTDTVLELGCGAARFTELITGGRRKIVGVDFSLEALRLAQDVLEREGGSESVGLVHASITDFKVQPGSFDVVFSTLTSNLPNLEHRRILYGLAARALKPGGRFVFSTHHQGLRERLKGLPKASRYKDGGIFFYRMGIRELRSELSPVFAGCRIQPIRVYLPVLSRDPRRRVAISNIARRIPFVNELGNLLLCEAWSPRPI